MSATQTNAEDPLSNTPPANGGAKVKVDPNNPYHKMWAREDAVALQLRVDLKAVAVALSAVRREEYGLLHGATTALVAAQRDLRQRMQKSMRNQLLWKAWELADPQLVMLTHFDPIDERYGKMLLEAARARGFELKQIVDIAKAINAQAELAMQELPSGSAHAQKAVTQAAFMALLESKTQGTDIFAQLEPLVAAVVDVTGAVGDKGEVDEEDDE